MKTARAEQINVVIARDVEIYNTSNQPVEVAMSKVLYPHHSKEKQFNQLKIYHRKIQSSWYKNGMQKQPICKKKSGQVK